MKMNSPPKKEMLNKKYTKNNEWNYDDQTKQTLLVYKKNNYKSEAIKILTIIQIQISGFLSNLI